MIETLRWSTAWSALQRGSSLAGSFCSSSVAHYGVYLLSISFLLAAVKGCKRIITGLEKRRRKSCVWQWWCCHYRPDMIIFVFDLMWRHEEAQAARRPEASGCCGTGTFFSFTSWSILPLHKTSLKLIPIKSQQRLEALEVLRWLVWRARELDMILLACNTTSTCRPVLAWSFFIASVELSTMRLQYSRLSFRGAALLVNAWGASN